LKAERARFLTEEVRGAEPETEPFLTRWGKSGVFSESTVLSFLGGRFHRLPSIDDSGRLNLQGRSFHSRVFHPKQYGRELSEVIQRLDFSIIFGIELVIKKYLFSEYVWEG
jgi:hypothetical protein